MERIYLDVEGTLIAYRMKSGICDEKQPTLRPHADRLLMIVQNHPDFYQATFLSGKGEAEIRKTFRRLGVDVSHITYTHWDTYKPSGINQLEPYFWIDDMPTLTEIRQLTDPSRLIHVIPYDPENPLTFDDLEPLCRFFDPKIKERDGLITGRDLLPIL